MSSSLSHAKLTLRPSAERGHALHTGFLDSYHTFSFANYYDPKYIQFGALRVLNEDRVEGNSGFPTHPHKNAEIFSYILSGELTHRDSMIEKGREGEQGDDFYKMKRGDVQFTTGGTGISHSEQNETNEQVHFLQIWALPWAKNLTPRYHTKTFSEEAKRKAFVPILSPLAAGSNASPTDESAAVPSIPGTIPIHADLIMLAGILAPQKTFTYSIGGTSYGATIARTKTDRKVYVHIAMTQGGFAKVKINAGRETITMKEGDGLFVEGLSSGDVLNVDSIGAAEAEIIILDSTEQ